MGYYKQLSIDMLNDLKGATEMCHSLIYRFENYNVCDADIVNLDIVLKKLSKVRNFYAGAYDYTDAVSTGFESEPVSSMYTVKEEGTRVRSTIYTEYELEQLRHYLDHGSD